MSRTKLGIFSRIAMIMHRDARTSYYRLIPMSRPELRIFSRLAMNMDRDVQATEIRTLDFINQRSRRKMDVDGRDDLQAPLLQPSGSFLIDIPDEKTQTITFKMGGINYASCQTSIESALLKVNGIESVSVSSYQGQAAVKYVPEFTSAIKIKESLRRKVFQLVNFQSKISHELCGRCDHHPIYPRGVNHVEMDLTENRITVTYEPDITGPRSLIHSIQNAGKGTKVYNASLHVTPSGREVGWQQEIRTFRNLFCLGCLFSLPLCILSMVLPMLPPYKNWLDYKMLTIGMLLRWILCTPVQLIFGQRFYVGVIGGTLNENGCLLAKATHVGSDTTLSQVVRIVETTQLAGAPAQKLADQISKFLVLIASVLVSIEYLLYTYLSFPAINGYLQDTIVFLPSTISDKLHVDHEKENIRILEFRNKCVDMDNSGLRGRFLSDSSGGLLDLESPIHRHQQSQLGHPSLAHQHQMNVMGCFDNDHQPTGLMEMKGSTSKGYLVNFGKGRAASPFNSAHSGDGSEDDDQSFMEDGNGENSTGAKGKQGSPWQRMKWTDNVVRLLISVVACVGDDDTFDGMGGLKRKSGLLQKKGKWKTVSKLMIGKGCHVSPQQCEDKFNDLNKRYKRLNEILGRGTSCRVVENPALMDSMPHLSAKAKDDVRKILSSKHLFYKEICAYHNGQRIPNCQDFDLQGCSLPLERCSKETNGSGGDEVEGNDDSDDDESNNEADNNADENGESVGQLCERIVNEEHAHLCSQSGRQNSFGVEMTAIFQDTNVSPWERKEWIKKQRLQLLEQRVNIKAQAFELEKQQFKWLRYRSKKDKEFERLRLENERKRLENRQSAFQLRQKQLEMGFRSSEPAYDPTSLGIDRVQGRDQIDLGRHH
ncbi:hypothetical protein D5086_007616 [Populus alba]|uniref:Uncharacterized protein n=1 Tax=Populus alba TaxID=43335 RepID=A0ACC4CP14_POPAL